MFLKMVEDGHKMIHIAREQFGYFARYHSGIQKFKELVEREKRSVRREDLKVYLYYGCSRGGKTYTSLDKYATMVTAKKPTQRTYPNIHWNRR